MAGGKGGQNFVAKTFTTYMYIIITICSITYNTILYVRVYATCDFNVMVTLLTKKNFQMLHFFCWANMKKRVGFQLIWTPTKTSKSHHGLVFHQLVFSLQEFLQVHRSGSQLRKPFLVEFVGYESTVLTGRYQIDSGTHLRPI